MTDEVEIPLIPDHPPVTVLSYLKNLGFAVPMSKLGKEPKEASGQERRQWVRDGAIVINGKPWVSLTDELEFPITSLVFFPNSKKHRTTLL